MRVGGERPYYRTYLKKINVICPKCEANHEYPILVEGITGHRVYASYAIDCGHHCKSCGFLLETIPDNPLPYTPDSEEVKLKRCESEIRKRKKTLINRAFIPEIISGEEYGYERYICGDYFNKTGVK